MGNLIDSNNPVDVFGSIAIFFLFIIMICRFHNDKKHKVHFEDQKKEVIDIFMKAVEKHDIYSKNIARYDIVEDIIYYYDRKWNKWPKSDYSKYMESIINNFKTLDNRNNLIFMTTPETLFLKNYIYVFHFLVYGDVRTKHFKIG